MKIKNREKKWFKRLDEMNNCYLNLENEIEGDTFYYISYITLIQMSFINRIGEIINEV